MLAQIMEKIAKLKDQNDKIYEGMQTKSRRNE